MGMGEWDELWKNLESTIDEWTIELDQISNATKDGEIPAGANGAKMPNAASQKLLGSRNCAHTAVTLSSLWIA